MGYLSPAEERRQVLLYAAGSGRADIISMAIEQETAEGGDVASLLTSQDEMPGIRSMLFSSFSRPSGENISNVSGNPLDVFFAEDRT